jgi:hypothetical protein
MIAFGGNYTVPVEGIIKKGRKRERGKGGGEEGKRKKKRRKRKEEKKEGFNGSTHALSKFATPQVRFHKHIDCLLISISFKYFL